MKWYSIKVQSTQQHHVVVTLNYQPPTYKLRVCQLNGTHLVFPGYLLPVENAKDWNSVVIETNSALQVGLMCLESLFSSSFSFLLGKPQCSILNRT